MQSVPMLLRQSTLGSGHDERFTCGTGLAVIAEQSLPQF